jgi:hypothetical protein
MSRPISFFIEADRRFYQKTKNPLHVWETIYHCISKNIALPNWVLEYLKNTAINLLELEPPKGEAARLVKNALGFHGRHFAQWQRPADDYDLYEKVKVNIEKFGTLSKSIEHVSNELGLSVETIKKKFYEMKKAVPEYDKLIGEIDKDLDLNNDSHDQ